MQKVKMVGNCLSLASEGVSWGGVTIGKEYIALEFTKSGGVHIIDDDGDNSELYRSEYEIVEDSA